MINATTSEGDEAIIIETPRELAETLEPAFAEGVETNSGSIEGNHYVLFRFDSTPNKVYAVRDTQLLIWASAEFMTAKLGAQR